MADDTPDDTPASKGGKGEKRREQILVASAVFGLILTVILIRRSPKGTAAQGLPVSAPIGNQPGAVNTITPGDFGALQAQVQGLTGEVSALEAMSFGGLSSSPTGISHTHAPAQAVTQPTHIALSNGQSNGPVSLYGTTSASRMPTGPSVNHTPMIRPNV